MEILSFKVSGKLAHFRKYFANNTAFSFSIPPRTTLMGIVAGYMGWPKNSYYEKLSSENVNFGVRVLNPIKKGFQKLNYLKIDNVGDFRGKQGRIQTPFEIISPLNLHNDEVAYQVFLKPKESGKSTFIQLTEHLLYKEPVYATTLGPANFTAKISDCILYKQDGIEEKESEDFVMIHSAIPVDLVEVLNFDKEFQAAYNFVEEDMLPGDFMSDNNREVKKMNQLLFSITSFPLRVKVKGKYWKLEKDGEVLNIQFMDL